MDYSLLSHQMPLKVQTHNTESAPQVETDGSHASSRLSPMCGWQKEATTSPRKPVVTPTKHRVKPETQTIVSPVRRDLLPMCYTVDEPTSLSPTKSDSGQSGHVTDASDENSDNLLYFKVPGICLKDLYDWSERWNECRVTTVNPTRGLLPQKSSSGSTVELNEELIALFRYDDSVFAVLEKCPHAGGPLHLGDIEVLPSSRSLCVTCPWHSWKMDLSSGKVLFPPNRSQRTRVFPTMLGEEGEIYVGFDTLSAEYFNLSSDF